jgi:hypothetical protein
MTDQEIEQKRERLVGIKKIEDHGERNNAIHKLIEEAGAAGCAVKTETTGHRDALNIASIHQALQTAAMVNMSKSATTGCEDAKKSGKRMAIVAIISAIAAVLSALVALVAVIK